MAWPIFVVVLRASKRRRDDDESRFNEPSADNRSSTLRPIEAVQCAIVPVSTAVSRRLRARFFLCSDRFQVVRNSKWT